MSNDGATVFVGSDAGIPYALDEVTGIVLWTAATGSPVTADPAGGCGAGTCAALWTAPATGAIEQQPVAAGGVVFAGTDDGELHGFAVDG